MFARNQRGERRASPRVYKLLLTAHIITSVGWLGAVFAKLVLAVAAVTTSSPDDAAALLLALNVINGAFAPAAIGTLVSGVLLSLGTRWGLLDHYWVLTKLVLTIGVFGTAVQLVPRLVGLQVDEPTLLGLPWAPAILLGFAALHLLMLGTATAVSVFKPWGRTWFGRRASVPHVRIDGSVRVERVA